VGFSESALVDILHSFVSLKITPVMVCHDGGGGGVVPNLFLSLYLICILCLQ
jgi:hypothetical protein